MRAICAFCIVLLATTASVGAVGRGLRQSSGYTRPVSATLADLVNDPQGRGHLLVRAPKCKLITICRRMHTLSARAADYCDLSAYLQTALGDYTNYEPQYMYHYSAPNYNADPSMDPGSGVPPTSEILTTQRSVFGCIQLIDLSDAVLFSKNVRPNYYLQYSPAASLPWFWCKRKRGTHTGYSLRQYSSAPISQPICPSHAGNASVTGSWQVVGSSGALAIHAIPFTNELVLFMARPNNANGSEPNPPLAVRQLS